MRAAWIGWGGAALAAVLTLVPGGPLKAADDTSVHYVAEELGSRTKAPQTSEGAAKDKLSDSAVRVMSTFALSILPDEIPTKSGEMVKLDKSDPNKYLIPLDDARRVIRVATRSAYAEVCGLTELEKANYETLMRSEQGRQTWNADQMMFIHALHTFATSYFAGNVKITEQSENAVQGAEAKEGAAAANAANGPTTTITTKKLECQPGQKEKVAAAINSYVQSNPTAAPVAPAAPPTPMAPAAAAAPQAEPGPALAPVAGAAN
jgi:hypothetical protein